MPDRETEMKRAVLCLTLAMLVAAPAQAAPGDMSVATFLAKVNALKAKGMAALFSSDVKLLREEATAAGLAYRARLDKERTAGKPSSCPPKPTKVSQDMWLGHLNSYPAAQRGQINLHRAMADMFAKTWPCR
jgi:hypothetical protein